MRTILTVATVWFATIILAPIAIIGRLLGLNEGEHGVAQWCMRTWARSMCVAAGVKVVVHNPERMVSEGAVYACNHVSWFDVFAIASVLPRYTFIAKAELRKLPLGITSRAPYTSTGTTGAWAAMASTNGPFLKGRSE